MLPDPYAGEPAPPMAPAPARGSRISWLALALIIVNGALLGYLGWRAQRPVLTEPAFATLVPSKLARTIPLDLGSTPAAVATKSGNEQRTIDIFRNASPSVVFITTLKMRRDFFRRDITSMPAGTGSGFLWDDQGHVVTNFHVVKDGDAARVTLEDQKSYPAKLVGTAPDKDLAVLKIVAPAGTLRALTRGVSSNLVVGQSALAIGNPFGLDHTLSTGVVSGLGREIKSASGRPIADVIQTDAAINPGNSGGPLLDSSGRLIGVNTAIYSPSGASAGIGFAIPVDTVNRIVPQLIEHGRLVRPGLGVRFDPDLQKRAGIVGVLVLAVQAGSAAAEAGMRPTRRAQNGDLILGDVIVAIAGKVVKDPDDLFRALDGKSVGETVGVTVERDKKRVDLKLKLKALE